MTTYKTSWAVAAWALIVSTQGASSQTAPVLDIPAQPLQSAIAELIETTDLEVMVHSELVQDKQSRPVQGQIGPIPALKAMVEGSGLTVKTFAGQSAAVVPDRDVVSQNAQEDTLDLGTIVLRGELIERSVQDSQTSTAVITGDDLERRGELRFDSVIERTPGISSTFSNFSIRGIQSFGPSASGGASTITTSVDGVRVSGVNDFIQGSFSTWDLEQIEVLRGPQSTQSGRNALAGAIIVKSKDPTYERDAQVRLGFGNGERFTTAVLANVPLIDGKLALRFAAEGEWFERFTTNFGRGTDGENRLENRLFRVGLRFDPTPNFSGVIKYTNSRYEDSAVGANASTFPARIVNFDQEDIRNGAVRSLNTSLNYRFNDQWRLESSTIVSKISTLNLSDLDGTPAVTGYSFRPGTNETIEQEFRLYFEGDRVTAVAGLFFTDIEADNVSALRSITPAGQLNFDLRQLVQTENYALFGEAEIELTPYWDVILGGRYDIETVDFSAVTTLSFTPPGGVPLPRPGPPNEVNGGSYDAFLPKIGVVYNFHEDVSLGLTYQRGYRAGGARTNFGAVDAAGNIAPRVVEFDPEFTDNFELAFRSVWLDGNLTVNANAFYTDYTDMQVFVQLSPNPLDTEVRNAGAAELFGAELDVRATPTANLEVFGGVAYVDTEFKRFVSNGVNLAGNEFTFAPNWTATLGAQYTFNNGVYVGGDISYTGEFFNDAANNPLTRNNDRLLIGLRAGYETDRISLVAFVNNLLDEDYTLFRGAQVGTVAPNSISLGEPRTFGALATFKF